VTDIIIIKDIDARHSFGNFMNRLQDKVVNGETVYDVDPGKLKAYFELRGFTVSYYFKRRFWYPHFILTAKRSAQ
jgi:hypothetical protein